MEIRRAKDWQEAEVHRVLWEQWVVQAAVGGQTQCLPSIYQTLEWNRLWWESFGGSSELLLLLALDGAELAGAAPLMIETLRGRRVVRLIGTPNFATDFGALILPPDRGRAKRALEALVGWLKDQRDLWDEIDLYYLPGDSEDLSPLEDAFPGRLLRQEVCDAPTRLLNHPEEDARLPLKKSLKRHHNWFARQGELTFTRFDRAEDILPKLDAFFAQHIERRALEGEVSQFKDPLQKRFYEALVRAMAPRGWITFATVSFNGELIAQHLGFLLAKRFYWYKPTFAAKYEKHSPGEVLLKALFESALAEKLVEFDFTAGGEGFKYRFANHIRKLHRFRIYRTLGSYTRARLRRSLAAGWHLARKTLRPPKPAPTPPANES